MAESENFIDKSKKVGRTTLSMNEKLKIIELAGKHTHQEIANQFNVGRSTVTKILSKKDKIIDSSKGICIDLRRRVRSNSFGDIEKKVLEWCAKDAELDEEGTLTLNTRYDSEKIIKKAKEIANEMNQQHFFADNVWLMKFRRRFRLKFDIKKLNDSESFENNSELNVCNQNQTPTFNGDEFNFDSNSNWFEANDIGLDFLYNHNNAVYNNLLNHAQSNVSNINTQHNELGLNLCSYSNHCLENNAKSPYLMDSAIPSPFLTPLSQSSQSIESFLLQQNDLYALDGSNLMSNDNDFNQLTSSNTLFLYPTSFPTNQLNPKPEDWTSNQHNTL